MPNLVKDWFKEFGHSTSPNDIEIFQNLIDDKIKPGLAAKLFTKNINLKSRVNTFDGKLETIVSLAISLPDSALLEKFVNLASEIQDLQIDAQNLRNKVSTFYILHEMDMFLADTWESFWCNSWDLTKAEPYSEWISINEFSARLTKAKIFDATYQAVMLCNNLLEDHKLGENPIRSDVDLSEISQKVRQDPTLFALAISAAAQYMIYAASNLYIFCKKQRTHRDLEYRWEDWKDTFKEAETIKNIKARNDALSAVVAMDTAQQVYDSCQIPEEKQITTYGLPKKTEQSKNFDGSKPQEKKCGQGWKKEKSLPRIRYKEYGIKKKTVAKDGRKQKASPE